MHEPIGLTIKEAAKYLQYTPFSIWRFIKYKKLPAYRIGGKWRISKKHLDDMFEIKKEKP